MEEEIKEILNYYKGPGGRTEQSDLIQALREIQELCNGILTENALYEVCTELNIKRNYLDAVMKFVSDLKTENVKHRLEICGGKNCQSNNGRRISDFIEKEYNVRSGNISETGSFFYKTGGCMKNCKKGPCVKLDGEIYTEMTVEKLKTLLNNM